MIMKQRALLWLGEEKQGMFVNGQDKVMDSVFNYLKDDEPRIRYSYRKLFLDNGAYSAARKEKELDREKVKEIQETINPNFTIPKAPL